MQGGFELFEMLGQIDRTKPLGTSLFDALARVTISIGVEAVCLRLNSQKVVEVYLTQRAPNDTAYLSEWHCPRSILQPTEKWGDVLSRLAVREFGGKILSARFVANINHPMEARGHVISVVYLCTLQEEEGHCGQWFRVDQLPEKTVECHRHRVIPCAVGAFVAEDTKICW